MEAEWYLRRMNIPDNLKYTKEHVGALKVMAVIGITDFAQRVQNIVFVEVETVDETLARRSVRHGGSGQDGE